MKNLHALVLGATGATGQELVKLLLNDPDISKVSIFVRKKLNITHIKLTVHEINFSKLKNYKEIIKGDILFSVLGTTRRDAGDKQKQYLVDYHYQYEFAKIASENGLMYYSLVSSIGANKNSYFFYPKMKGDLEEAVKCLNFRVVQIFQPPSLIRPPHLIRNVEKLSLFILKIFNYFGFLKLFKPISVFDLAVKMIREIKASKTKKISTYTADKI